MRPIDAEACTAELREKLSKLKQGEETLYSYLAWFVNYLDKLYSYLAWFVNYLDKQPTVNQWIPVSERLPENECKKYWVCTDIGYQYECRWTNVNPIWTDLTTDWHWNIFDTPQYTKVVAWMPLPEPYKGVTE